MTIASIANTLQDGRLRDRFHAEPMIQGVELLLHERVPRAVAAAPPRAKDVVVGTAEISDTPTMRVFDARPRLPHGASAVKRPIWCDADRNRRRFQLLARSGNHPLAVRGNAGSPGSFIYIRDTTTGTLWSAGVQPIRADTPRHRTVFSEHQAAFIHQEPNFTTTTEVVTFCRRRCQARRVTLTNTGRRSREFDVTSYAELALAAQSADQAHPVFSKMFVVTDYLPELGVIIATRRRRSPSDPEVWAAHIAVVEGPETGPIQIETDRAKLIGRGHSLQDPVMADAALSGTTGTVIDPIFSIRRRVSIPAGGVTRVTFWTMVAQSPDALLDIVDRHRDPSAFARAATLSWTQAQVQLRHLGISHADAAEFQALGGMVLRSDTRLRASPAQIAAGAAPQSALWAMGISGDLPIVLVQIDDTQDIGVLQQVLSAHEYWGTRQLSVDLVILNKPLFVLSTDLQIAIESAVRTAQTRPKARGSHAPVQGSIYALRSDIINPGARAALLSVARLVIVAGRGDIGQQLALLSAPKEIAAPAAAIPAMIAPTDHAGTSVFQRHRRVC